MWVLADIDPFSTPAGAPTVWLYLVGAGLTLASAWGAAYLTARVTKREAEGARVEAASAASTAASAATVASDVQAHVGQTNGKGTLAEMLILTLAELGEVKATTKALEGNQWEVLQQLQHCPYRLTERAETATPVELPKGDPS